jgi:hypothetical protein
MNCGLCNTSIKDGEAVNLHHPIYRSNGGTETIPTHERCHRELHNKRGDFRRWGKLSSLTRAWAFNLRNVKDHPAFDFDRAYYLALYAH